MDQPVIKEFNPLMPLVLKHFEHYLPASFDDSMTILEKVNKINDYITTLGSQHNDLVAQWNSVMLWITTNGVQDATNTKILELLNDGTIGDLINNVLLETTNTKISNIKNDLDLNVKNYGAVGDGVTDDSVAIQNAFNDAITYYNTDGIKRAIWFPKGLYLITNTIVASDSSFIVKMDGALYFDRNVKYGFDFNNISALEIFLRITGKNMQQSDFVWSEDYSSNVAGLSVGLRIVNCEGVKLDSVFKNFYGRGIESIGSWQFNFGHSYAHQVGQFIFIKNPVGQTKSGIGSIGSFHGEELTGSYFNGVDISIQYYENYIPQNANAHAITFDNCGSLWIGKMLVGCNSVDYLVKFLSCKNFNVDTIYAYGQWNHTTNNLDSSQGIYINKCYSGNMKIHTNACKNNALVVEGLKGVFIDWVDLESQNVGVIRTITGYNVFESEIKLSSRYRYGAGLIIDNTATDGSVTDGLTMRIHSADRGTGNNDDIDLKVNESGGNMILSGRMGKVSLPLVNKICDNGAIVGTYTNPPNNSVTQQLSTINDVWQTYVPSLIWTGGIVPNSLAVKGRYKQIGKTVFYQISLSSPDGNNATGCNISLPVAPKNNGLYPLLPFFKQVASTITQIQYKMRDDGVNNDLAPLYVGTLTSGQSMFISLFGFYETN